MADQTIILEIKTNQQEIERTKLEIMNLKQEVSNYKTEAKKQGTAQDEVNKKLVGYQGEIKKSNDNLRQLTKEQKLNLQIVNAEKGSYDQLNAQLKKAQLQWKGLSQNQRENTKEGRALLAQQKQLTGQLKKLDAQTGTHNRNVGNYAQSIKGLATGFIGFTTVIYAAIRAVKEAIEINREFNKTFVSILGLLSEFEKKKYGEILKTGAIDVMAKYGLEIADVNKALFDTISNGIKAGDSIEFLDKSAKLAIAGNSDLSSVVKGATKIIAAYGDQAGTTDEILNAFFAAQVKGATTVELLANNIGKVASISAFAEIPINELFGTFAGLTKFLDGTEESATALTAAIQAIVKPSDQARAEFGKLGIEVGATAIQENGLLNTILQVSKASEGNSDVLAELIPNIRALKGITGLTSTSIAEIEQNILDLNDAESSSALVNKAFGEQMEDTSKQIELASGSWKRYIITLGEGEGMGLWKAIRTGFTDLLNNFTDLERQSQWLSKTVAEDIKNSSVDQIASLENLLTEGTKIYDHLIEVGAEGEARQTQTRIDNINKRLEELKKEPVYLAQIEAEKAAILQAAIDKENAIKETALQDELARNKAELEAKQALWDAEIEAQRKKKENIEELKGLELEDEVIRKAELKAEEIELEKQHNESLEKALELYGAVKIAVDGVTVAAKKSLWDRIGLNEQFVSESMNTANQLFNFSNALGNRRNANLKKQLDEGIISERDYAIESAKILRKQAMFEKVQALFNIAINTAIAVMKVTGQTGIGAPFIIPLIIAAGAIEAATVIAQPLPEIPTFAKGTVINKKGQVLQGASHANGGIKLYGEGEGGEPILTKSVMSNPVDAAIISAINEKHGGVPLYGNKIPGYFAQGGVTTNIEAQRTQIIYQPVLVVEDIHDIQATQQQIKTMSKL